MQQGLEVEYYKVAERGSMSTLSYYVYHDIYFLILNLNFFFSKMHIYFRSLLNYFQSFNVISGIQSVFEIDFGLLE